MESGNWQGILGISLLVIDIAGVTRQSPTFQRGSRELAGNLGVDRGVRFFLGANMQHSALPPASGKPRSYLLLDGLAGCTSYLPKQLPNCVHHESWFIQLNPVPALLGIEHACLWGYAFGIFFRTGRVFV